MKIYLFLLLSISSFRNQKVSGNEREYIERNFQGVSEEIKRKVTWDNVTRLYDLDK